MEKGGPVSAGALREAMMGAQGRHEGQHRLCETRNWSCRRSVRAVGLGLRGTDPGREGGSGSLVEAKPLTQPPACPMLGYGQVPKTV